MQKQTQSSKLIGISFPNELAEKLLAKARSTGKAFPWVVRYACLKLLASEGVDVTNIPNPEGRGVRSDLRKVSIEDKAERIKKARGFNQRDKSHKCRFESRTRKPEAY